MPLPAAACHSCLRAADRGCCEKRRGASLAQRYPIRQRLGESLSPSAKNALRKRRHPLKRRKMIDPPNRDTLDELRSEIDRIDAALHFLLMERGEIIHRLIEAKARQGSGSPLRPGSEAEMLPNLVPRHKGLLPLDTVE